MDWTQALTMTLTIIATLIASVFTFYRLTRDEIAVIREDMRHMDEKWTVALTKMDEKWERLFSLFIEKIGK